MISDAMADGSEHLTRAGVRPRRHAWRAMSMSTMLWLVAIILSLASTTTMSITRTQEARVLATAREMVTTGGRTWLIPQLNGEPRLQKPPLAYWLAGASFMILPFETWAGRVPFVVCGWLIVATTGAFAFRLAGRTSAVLTMGFLAGMFAFRRYASFAETDVLATLFATLAAWAFWEFSARAPATQGHDPGSAAPPSLVYRLVESRMLARWRFAWAHAAGAAIALTILSKGLQAAFPVLFFAGYALLTRRPRLLAQWCATGAPMTVALLAAPWFIYVMQSPAWTTLASEVDVALTGGAHIRPLWYYVPQLFIGALPWSPLGVVAAIAMRKNWWRDDAARLSGVWLLAILVPLSLAQQKQAHYIVPALPPLALMLARLTAVVLAEAAPAADRLLRHVAGATVSTWAVVGFGLVLLGMMRDRIGDPGASLPSAAIGVGILMLVMAMIPGRMARSHTAHFLPLGLPASCICMTAVVGIVAPARSDDTIEAAAQVIADRVNGETLSELDRANPALSFLMGRRIRVIPHGAARAEGQGGHDAGYVLIELEVGEAPPCLDGLVPELDVTVEDEHWLLLRVGHGHAS